MCRSLTRHRQRYSPPPAAATAGAPLPSAAGASTSASGGRLSRRARRCPRRQRALLLRPLHRRHVFGLPSRPAGPRVGRAPARGTGQRQSHRPPRLWPRHCRFFHARAAGRGGAPPLPRRWMWCGGGLGSRARWHGKEEGEGGWVRGEPLRVCGIFRRGWGGGAEVEGGWRRRGCVVERPLARVKAGARLPVSVRVTRDWIGEHFPCRIYGAFNFFFGNLDKQCTWGRLCAHGIVFVSRSECACPCGNTDGPRLLVHPAPA